MAYNSESYQTTPYPNGIMQMVRQRMGWPDYDTSHDDKIRSMSHNEVLDKCFECVGILPYTLSGGDTVRSWIKDIYGVTLE